MSPVYLKQTTRERILKWVDRYSSKNYGVLICCKQCDKWRRSFEYSESHEVPIDWICSMLTLDYGRKGNCEDPEESFGDFFEYCPGSVVWAKVGGYPWWPGMIDVEPDTEEYYFYNEKRALTYYNVTFLDEHPTRAWISEKSICPFLQTPRQNSGFKQDKKYYKAIEKAKETAQAAMKMTLQRRLQVYTFGRTYKGHWPRAVDYGYDSGEDTTISLLSKEIDKSSNHLTNTDNKSSETLAQKKNQSTKNEESISSYDVSALQEKQVKKRGKYNAKYFASERKKSENQKIQDSLNGSADKISRSSKVQKVMKVERKKNRKFSSKMTKKVVNLDCMPVSTGLKNVITAPPNFDEPLNSPSVQNREIFQSFKTDCFDKKPESRDMDLDYLKEIYKRHQNDIDDSFCSEIEVSDEDSCSEYNNNFQNKVDRVLQNEMKTTKRIQNRKITKRIKNRKITVNKVRVNSDTIVHDSTLMENSHCKISKSFNVDEEKLENMGDTEGKKLKEDHKFGRKNGVKKGNEMFEGSICIQNEGPETSYNTKKHKKSRNY